MSKLKKVLLMCAAYVLVAALAIGGTMAYLTSEDSDVNVMTLGNVKIEQIEQERKDGTKGELINNLKDFTQAKGAYPYTGKVNEQGHSNGGFDFTGVKWSEDSDRTFKLFTTANNVVDKFVTVKNIGKSDAFVRTILAFEEGSDMDKLVQISANINDTDWTWSWMDGYININGSNYSVAEVVYKTELKAGETTLPSLLQVYLNAFTTNEDMELLGETWEILVLSQAVQTEGFETAQIALDTAFGKTSENAAKWFEGKTSLEDAGNNDELEDALTGDEETIVVNLTGDVTYDVAAWQEEAMGGEKTKNILINGNGHTITFHQTNSDWTNIVTNGAKLTITNATITNSGYDATSGTWNGHDICFNCDVEFNDVTFLNAIALCQDAVLNNVKITDDSTGDAYMVWIKAQGQTVVFNGCEIDALGTDGNDRGIKIDEEYVSAPAKVTLKVSNTTFKTEKKAAILVKSVAGADITINNVDISGVKDDVVNHVWVDEASAAYADLVTVTGGNKVIEGQKGYDLAISNADELFAFAAAVNGGNSYSGKTVILTADIDLTGKTWTPIGQTGATTFAGNFNGMGHTISNLTVDSSSQTGKNYSSGLFGWIEIHGSKYTAIENLNVVGAKITGNHNCGTIVGYATGSTMIKNCSVSNATIICNVANEDANGDKAGVIAGNITAEPETKIVNCTASNSTVTAGRDAGQLAGAGNTENVNGTATNVTVTANGQGTGANINNELVGRDL